MLILLAFGQLWRNLRDTRWINRHKQEVSLRHDNVKMSRTTLNRKAWDGHTANANRKSKWFSGKHITVPSHSLILQCQRKITSSSIWFQAFRTTVCLSKLKNRLLSKVKNRLPLDRTCFKSDERACFKSVDFEPTVNLARMDAEVKVVGTYLCERWRFPYKLWPIRT